MSYLYIAAPLFSQAEIDFNARVAAVVERYFPTFLPQRDGKMFANIATVRDDLRASRSIMEADCDQLDQAVGMVAVLDGDHVDDGVCFELGYLSALNRRRKAEGKREAMIIGLKTDERCFSTMALLNPMLRATVKVKVEDLEALDIAIHSLKDALV